MYPIFTSFLPFEPLLLMSLEIYPDGEEFLEELEYGEKGQLQFTPRAMKVRITVS